MTTGAATVGNLIGVSDIEDFRSDRDAAGNHLSWGTSVFHGARGIASVALTVVAGLKTIPRGAVAESASAGRIVDVPESMSKIAAQYQEQVAGLRAGRAFLRNGVRFDGFRNGQLLEAKGVGYVKLLKHPEISNKIGYRLLDQAERQLIAADGVGIKWIVAEEEFAVALRGMFDLNSIRIDVIHQMLTF